MNVTKPDGNGGGYLSSGMWILWESDQLFRVKGSSGVFDLAGWRS